MDLAEAPEPVPPLRTPGYSGAFSQPLQPLQPLQPGVERDMPAKQVWEI
jgi:hypothetical protein